MFPSNELMARIDIPFWRNGIILVTSSATCKTLGNTGPIIEGNIEVEKIKGNSLASLIKVDSGEFFIFFIKDLPIVFRKDIRFICPDNRFHGNFGPHLEHSENIIGKMRVVMGIGSPEIIVASPPAFNDFLEPFNGLIKRTQMPRIRSHMIVCLFAPV